MRKLIAVAVCAVLAGPALAQEAPPKPGPEHEVLKLDVGTWDASVESWLEPGKPAQVSKGVETSVMAVGGFWLITDMKADMGGMPYEGHGVTGWDPAKKKYVGTWSDNMSPGLNLGWSDFDAKTKTARGTMEGLGPDGKVAKSASVVEHKADGSRVFTMSSIDAAGKQTMTMRITYTRRK